MLTQADIQTTLDAEEFRKRRLTYPAAILLVTGGVALSVLSPTCRARLFAANFLPHFYCYLGRTGLVWTHVVSDSLIALSYLAISATLVYLARRTRHTIPFQWVFLAFGLFILACGATHLMEVVTVWIPVYVLSGGVKVFTAVTSVATAVMLPFAIPQVLTLIQTAHDSKLTHERLRLAMECGKSVGWDWDISTGQDSWFGDLQTTFGIPSSTHNGRIEDFYRRVHPEDRDQVAKAVREAMTSRRHYAEEFRVVRADGTMRWLAAKGSFHYGTNGGAVRMLGMAVDVTERKQSEESLKLFRKLIDASNDAFEVIDPITLRFLDMNETGCKDLGYSCEEVLALTVRDVNPEVDKPELVKVWSRLEQSGSITVETVHRRKDGSTFPVEVNARCVQFDRRYTVAVVRDISERKRTQEILQESEERLRLAVQAGKMFAYSWDAATDVIKRSGASCKILGISEATPLTGQQALATVHSDDQERLKAAIAQLSPENPHLQIVYRMVRPDGSLVWLERTSRAYFDQDGKLLRIVGMVADVTERKLAEEVLSSVSRRLIEAQEAERARIARDLHDDFGQRLALLRVALDQLQSISGDSESEAIRHMADMRNQITELSAGLRTLAHELHPARLEYLGLVAAIAGFCREFSERRVAETRFTHKSVPNTVPQEVSLCLFRVLQESLRNAVKHSGVRHFEVELQGASESIRLTVRDQGVGFDYEKSALSRGLGITSMQERLKSVNGELSIVSHLSQGTTVCARVPLRTTSMTLPAAG